jgi:hypothetical protein
VVCRLGSFGFIVVELVRKGLDRMEKSICGRILNEQCRFAAQAIFDHSICPPNKCVQNHRITLTLGLVQKRLGGSYRREFRVFAKNSSEHVHCAICIAI